MESSFIHTGSLRSQMNPRGRKSVSGKPGVKPLLAESFLRSFLPDEMLTDDRWKKTYRIDENGTYVMKLMNGTTDGLSVHRQYLNELAMNRFRVSKESDVLFLSALSDKCGSFLDKFADTDASLEETLKYWDQETLGQMNQGRLHADFQAFLQEIIVYCRTGSAANALAAMVLLGLLSGLINKSPDLVHAWYNELVGWRTAGFPKYCKNASELNSSARHIRSRTVSRLFDDLRNTEPVLCPDLTLHNQTYSYAGGMAAILSSDSRILLITGNAGSGRKTLLRNICVKKIQNDDQALPIWIGAVHDSLFKTLCRKLAVPSFVSSWEDLRQLVSGFNLLICIPDLMYQSCPAMLVHEITESLSVFDKDSLRFIITSSVFPYELQETDIMPVVCLPLSPRVRRNYLRSVLSEKDFFSVRQNTVLINHLDTPLMLRYYGEINLYPESCDPAVHNGQDHFDEMDSTEQNSMSCYLSDEAIRYRQLTPVSTRTVSGVMYRYLMHFVRPGMSNELHNAAFMYILPAFAAYLTYLNVYQAGHRMAVSAFSDPETISVLHLDLLKEFRFAWQPEQIPEAFRILYSSGVLVYERQVYRFPSVQLQKFCCALHSLNMFDIEVKENVFIPSDYPYDAHTDMFWQMFSSETLAYYEHLLPVLESSAYAFSYARLYSVWATIIYYGNGSDEPGCILPALRGADAGNHMIHTMERASVLLAHILKSGTFPCAAWNYAFYQKRIAELLTDMEAEGDCESSKCQQQEPPDHIRHCFEEAYHAVKSIVEMVDRGDDIPDIRFAKKHIYDKYAQFLMQKCWPVRAAGNDLWIVPGISDVDKEMTLADLEKEQLRALHIAADNNNAIAINRLALMIKKKADSNTDLQKSGYPEALHLFQRSAALGDFFAYGMVVELLLDHTAVLGDEFLSASFTPQHTSRRPHTVAEALAGGLLADCCISYIRTAFDEDAYNCIISESRKSRFATAFHQLGRCYLMKKDTASAIKYLDAAAKMNWSQNDNTGEHDRLMKDLATARSF